MKIRRMVGSLALSLAMSPWASLQGMAEADPESRAASALLAQFETVVRARGSMLANTGPYRSLEKHDADELRLPFFLLEDGLQALLGAKKKTEAVLKSSDSVLLGAKDFRPPAGLGMVVSNRCYVIVPDPRRVFDFQQSTQLKPTVSPGGIAAWSWSAKLGEFGEEEPNKLSTFYAAQLGHRYFLVCNNLADLEALAGRLNAADESHTLAGLHGWEQVRGREFWAYRRYRKVEPPNQGAVEVASTAESLIFFVDFAEKSATLRVFASTPVTESPIQLKTNEYLSPFKKIDAQAWEAVFSLLGNEKSFYSMVAVGYLLGFGVYV